MNEYELAIQKMLTKMAVDIAGIKQTLEDDHKAVFGGDGKPGLVERVTQLETKIAVGVWGIRILCGVIGFVGAKILDVIIQRLAGN